MKKWKVEMWLEDTPDEFSDSDAYLNQMEIIEAIEKAEAAIEAQFDGLKVTNFDIYEDNQND